MINKINISQIKNVNTDINNWNKKISFSGNKDTFIRSNKLDSENAQIKNAQDFLSGIGIERLSSGLLNSGVWDNGSDIVALLYKDGKVESVMLNVYDFARGEQSEMLCSKDDFKKILKTVQDASIHKNPQKSQQINELTSKLLGKIDK